jgi:murein DD-endopeptidase MepM/ murein hydrolase activator NlpD
LFGISLKNSAKGSQTLIKKRDLKISNFSIILYRMYRQFIFAWSLIKNIVVVRFKGASKSPLLYLGAFLIIFFGFSLLFRQDLKSSGENRQNVFSRSLFLRQTKAAFLLESPQLLLIQNTALLAVAPPDVITPKSFGALFLATEPEDRKRVITEYIVQPGDTLSSLASEFNISLETLLWANNLNKNSSLKVGQKLIVPPVSGVIHHVKENDTVARIAEIYKGKVEEIIAFNELSEQGQIYIGDIIIIPGGVLPPQKSDAPAPVSVPLADSYFICPTVSCSISQGLHWYNAVDFQGSCGDSIRAAARGKVLKVALTSSTSRYAFGGAGNHIVILHPNGVTTFYGHILASLVNQGQEVSQGQTIALMGGQPGTAGAGLSTGCHVHFGVTGAPNPFSR